MNVSASGIIASPMIVYKYDRILSEISNAVPEEWRMGHSKTVWMITGSFFEYITNVFEPLLTANNIKDYYCFIFGWTCAAFND